jgi:hypothetical protein
MNKTGVKLIVFIATIAMIGACGVGKKPTRKNRTIESADKAKANTTIPNTATELPAERPTSIEHEINGEKKKLIESLMPLWNRQIPFETFSSKVKMKYEGKGQKLDFTANVRMKKDEKIWMLITAFLLPAVRIYVTPDSFQMINYLEKTAIKLPLNEATKILPVPVTFAMLQNMIIGNVLGTEGRAIDATEFGGSSSLHIEDNERVQQAVYNKSDNTMRSLQMRTKDNVTQAVIQYGNYTKYGDILFAESRAINVNNRGEQLYLEMNFNNIEFNPTLDFPFSIPKNYELKK